MGISDLKKYKKEAIGFGSLLVFVGVIVGIIIFIPGGDTYHLQDGKAEMWDNEDNSIFKSEIKYRTLWDDGRYHGLNRKNHYDEERGKRTNCYAPYVQEYNGNFYFEEKCDYSYGIEVIRFAYDRNGSIKEGFRPDPKDRKMKAYWRYNTGSKYNVKSVDRENKIVYINDREFSYKDIADSITGKSPMVYFLGDQFEFNFKAFTGVQIFDPEFIRGRSSEHLEEEIIVGRVMALDEGNLTVNLSRKAHKKTKKFDDEAVDSAFVDVWVDGLLYFELNMSEEYKVRIRERIDEEEIKQIRPDYYECEGFTCLVGFNSSDLNNTELIILHIGNSDEYEIDLTQMSSHAGQNWVWLDNMAKNSTNSTVLITKDLVAYYDLRNNLSEDRATGIYNGTITGAVNTTGHFGESNSAFSFDGVDNYITIGTGSNFSDLCANNQCSFSSWFNTDFASASQTIVGHYDGNLNDRFFIYRIVSNDLNFLIDSDGTRNDDCNIQLDGDIISSNQWYHYVVSWDGINVNFYLNGVFIEAVACSITINETAWEDSSEPTFIGIVDNTGLTGDFNGSIDNVRIYNRSLSAEEVKGLSEERNDNHINGSFSTAFCIKDCINNTGRVGQWALNRNANDETGNNDGTITGALNSSDCRYGDCMDFDGSNQRIVVPDSDDFFFNDSDFSISIWLEFNTTDGDRYQSIIGQFYEGSSLDWLFQTDFSTSDYILFYRNGAEDTRTDALTVIADEWYLFTFVMRDSIMYFYQNDVLVGSGASGAIDNSPDDLEISGSSSGFNGKIDNLIIWNGSLSQKEISDLYLSGYETPIDNAVFNRFEYDGGTGSCSLSDITDDCDTRAVSHWKLDNDAIDCSGGNNGTINGATNTTGFFNNAMEFNGINNVITGNITGINNSALTISAWIKYDRIITYSNAVGLIGTGAQKYISLGVTLNKITYAIQTGPGTQDNIQTVSTFDDGEWHHVAVTSVGGMATDINIFVDGIDVPDTITLANNAGTDITVTGFEISNNSKKGSKHFNGSIDDPRIYNYSLSDYEIWELYNARFDDRTAYSSGEVINLLASQQSDYGICEIDCEDCGGFNYFNLTFGEGRFPSPFLDIYEGFLDIYGNNQIIFKEEQ